MTETDLKFLQRHQRQTEVVRMRESWKCCLHCELCWHEVTNVADLALASACLEEEIAPPIATSLCKANDTPGQLLGVTRSVIQCNLVRRLPFNTKDVGVLMLHQRLARLCLSKCCP